MRDNFWDRNCDWGRRTTGSPRTQSLRAAFMDLCTGCVCATQSYSMQSVQIFTNLLFVERALTRGHILLYPENLQSQNPTLNIFSLHTLVNGTSKKTQVYDRDCEALASTGPEFSWWRRVRISLRMLQPLAWSLFSLKYYFLVFWWTLQIWRVLDSPMLGENFRESTRSPLCEETVGLNSLCKCLLFQCCTSKACCLPWGVWSQLVLGTSLSHECLWWGEGTAAIATFSRACEAVELYLC